MSRSNGYMLQVSNLHREREGYDILRGVNRVVEQGTVCVVLDLSGKGARGAIMPWPTRCRRYAPPTIERRVRTGQPSAGWTRESWRR